MPLDGDRVAAALRWLDANEYSPWVDSSLWVKAAYGDVAMPAWIAWSQTADEAHRADESECTDLWDKLPPTDHRITAQPVARWIMPGMGVRGSANAREIASTPIRAPCGMLSPNLRQNPRRALIRLVRAAIHNERGRCNPCTACCSTNFRAKQPPEAYCSMILQPCGHFGLRWYGLHHLVLRFYFTKRPVYY